MQKMDFYTEITNRFVEKLEQGVKPWACPWVTSPVTGGLPANAKTGAAFNGANILCLWFAAEANRFTSRYWLTFKQAVEMGGYVNKDEKGTRVVFYRMREVTNAEGEAKEMPVVRHYTAFNLDQIEGIADPDCGKAQGGGFDPIDAAERLIEATGASITECGDRAAYRPNTDEVLLPERERFDNAADFYATALHELAHWTAHASRLNREVGRKNSEAYAFEELVAELACAFVMADLGIQGNVQHENYIAGWLDGLKGDKRYLFRAAAQAGKAHQYLMGFIRSQEEQAAA